MAAARGAGVPGRLRLRPDDGDRRRRGDVTWTNTDNTAHTVTAGAPGEPTDEFETLELDPEASGSLTFPDAGSFAFFCEIHPAMVVTVDVG